MKTSAWKRAVEPLLPAGQRWEYLDLDGDGLFYRAPVRLTVSGICKKDEPAPDDPRARVLRLGHPLYVPMDRLHGWALFGWTAVGTFIHQQPAEAHEIGGNIEQALAELEDEDVLIRRIAAEFHGWPGAWVPHFEAIAGAFVLLGDYDGALSVAEAVRGEMRGQFARDPDPNTSAELVEENRRTLPRFEALMHTLQTAEGVAGARSQLEKTARQTAEAWGLATK